MYTYVFSGLVEMGSYSHNLKTDKTGIWPVFVAVTLSTVFDWIPHWSSVNSSKIKHCYEN